MSLLRAHSFFQSKSTTFWCWVIFIVIFCVVVLLSFLNTLSFNSEFRQNSTMLPDVSKSGMANGEAKVVIDFGNGQKRAFVGEANMKVDEALREIEAASHLPQNPALAVSVEGSSVVAIDGIKNSIARQWRAYSNGSSIADILGHTIREREEILFTYEALY